jgi:hypothetical protein
MKTYPNNTVANYQTLLPKPIELQGTWEVAMMELTYPMTWYTIEKGEWFKVRAFSLRRSNPRPIQDGDGDDGANYEFDGEWVDVGEGPMYLPEGRYTSVRELVDQMGTQWRDYWTLVNRAVVLFKSTAQAQSAPVKLTVESGKRLTPVEQVVQERSDEIRYPSIKEDSLRIELNDKAHRVKFITHRNSHSMSFSKRLADILSVHPGRDVPVIEAGRSMSKAARQKHEEETQGEVDLNRGRRSLFVYCSLVEDSIVGDSRVPLLRSVPVKGRYGETIREVFEQAMYMPVRTNNFDQIEISINTEDGQLVPFNSGVSSVTLHFRRVQQNIHL